MKKSRLKKSHSKSKLSWIIAGLAFFLAGSIYLAIASGTGPLSFLTKTPDINKVKTCNQDPACIDLMVEAAEKGIRVNNTGGKLSTENFAKEVQKQAAKIPKKEQDDAEFIQEAARLSGQASIPKDERDDVIKPSSVSQNSGSCPGGQQSVTTSTGTQCIPINGDSTSCGVYAYAQNNKCYKIGDEVSGGYKVCDWTFGGRPGVTWAFLSTNCPTKTEVKPGEPTNANDCSTSKDYPGWWSENEKKCVQVGQPITNSPLIVCGAGQRTDKPQYNYPTASTPENCSSYTAPPVIPPKPAPLSNEELERRQEDCRSNLKKYDIASGTCIALVKCTPVPLTAGAKSYTTCGADGKIDIKLCNNSTGFDANGLCPTTPTVIPPAPVTDPKEPKTVISPPVTTSGYIDNIGCSRRYQTTCKEADDGKWYPIVAPVNVPPITPVNPVDDRPATPQEEARTQTYDSYLGCSTKTGGLCKVDPDDPKKYVSISYIDPTPSKPTSITPVNPVDDKPATPQEEARTKIYNTYSDCSTKTSGLCKPDPNDPKKYVSISYVDPTDTTANPILVSPPQESSQEENNTKPSVWSRIIEFFTRSKSDSTNTEGYIDNIGCNQRYQTTCKEAADGKWYPTTNQQLVIPQEPSTEEVTNKPSLWSQIVEYFSVSISDKNVDPPQGLLDNPSCETRYQADCTQGSDGKWYPTFSK